MSKLFESMQKQLENPEPLVPELQAYWEIDRDMEMVRHPLVFSVPHFPHLNQWCNRSLKAKKKALQIYVEQKNWEGYIFFHARPYRLHALRELLGMGHYTLGSREFCQTLRNIWLDTEYPHNYQAEWNELFRHSKPSFMMNEMEIHQLEVSPKELKVYRGVAIAPNPHGEVPCDGISWSLNYEKARWFAKRLAVSNMESYVLHATVPKDLVIAYIAERGESEILIRSVGFANNRPTGFSLDSIESVV